jgi:hypothetical protein
MGFPVNGTKTPFLVGRYPELWNHLLGRGNMRPRAAIVAALAFLVGCSRSSTAPTTETIGRDLILTAYRQDVPGTDDFTQIHELRFRMADSYRAVATLYSDCRGSLVTLTPTPTRTDRILCDPGIFRMPSDSLSSIQIFIDKRGDMTYQRVCQDLTEASAPLRTRNERRVLLVETRPMTNRGVQGLSWSISATTSVTITTEQGAPVAEILQAVRRFAACTDDIRLAVLSRAWSNPPRLIDGPAEGPAIPSSGPRDLGR